MVIAILKFIMKAFVFTDYVMQRDYLKLIGMFLRYLISIALCT